MSKLKQPRNRKLQLESLPLQNITGSLNHSAPVSKNMSYTDDCRLSNLTNSPMSSLALNLSELSTGKSTPRRRLSMSSVDTLTPDEDFTIRTVLSAESGCFSGSPFDDSPTLVSSRSKRLANLLHPEIPLEAFSAKKKTIAFRKFISQPLPLRLDSPTEFLDEDKVTCLEDNEDDGVFSPDDASSQDSGLGFEKHSLSMSSFDDETSVGSSSPRLPSLEDLWNSMEPTDFKAPKGKPPKRSRSVIDDKDFNEDTCSPIKYSPVKSSLPKPSFDFSIISQKSTSESINVPTSSSTNTTKSSFDDGFQELFDMDDIQNEANDQVSSLMSAPLLHALCQDKHKDDGLSFLVRREKCTSKRVKFFKQDSNDLTPTSRPAMPRRIFQRSQSLDIRPRLSSKRCEPPDDIEHLVSNSKRLKGESNVFSSSIETSISNQVKFESLSSSTTICRTNRLQRCHSETEATIKSAVYRMAMEPNLIGDCSKAYCLPTTQGGKHPDLKYISSETLSDVLANHYSDIVEEYFIIDCRYPYEYEGGHIKNAINLYTKEAVSDKFLKTPLTTKNPNKRIILIFHCEFSSERGPGLSKFLRSNDRQSNKECYPFLHYPELYLLEGGYKEFFTNFKHLCEPREYCTMLDKNHSEALRKFRVKPKSWAGEKPKTRNLKF